MRWPIVEHLLSRRKRILSRLVKKTSTVLSPVFGVRGRGRDLFAAVERLDLEGIVAKRLADPYTPDTVWRNMPLAWLVTVTLTPGRTPPCASITFPRSSLVPCCAATPAADNNTIKAQLNSRALMISPKEVQRFTYKRPSWRGRTGQRG